MPLGQSATSIAHNFDVKKASVWVFLVEVTFRLPAVGAQLRLLRCLGV